MRALTSNGVAAFGLIVALGGCGLSDPVALPEAPSLGAAHAKAALPSGIWRLVSLRESGQAEVLITEPGQFTAEFGADGRVHLRADCNRCAAGYTAGDRSLLVGLMACTRAYCASAPLDTAYTSLMGSARTWSVSGHARLELSSEAGVLRFDR